MSLPRNSISLFRLSATARNPRPLFDLEPSLESIINGLIAEKRLRYLHGRFARNAIRLYREGPLHYKLEIFGVIWFTARSAADAIDAAYQRNTEKSMRAQLAAIKPEGARPGQSLSPPVWVCLEGPQMIANGTREEAEATAAARRAAGAEVYVGELEVPLQ